MLRSKARTSWRRLCASCGRLRNGFAGRGLDATGALSGLCERHEGAVHEVHVSALETGQVLAVANLVGRDRANLEKF
jgi:hypothetical protein